MKLRILSLLAVVLLLPAAPAQADNVTLQRRLNALGCNTGPIDGVVGDWTRSAIKRFQSRHGFAQDGYLSSAERTTLNTTTKRCDVRPVPRSSGSGRRIVLSQRQNWVWLVRSDGSVRAQGGIIDNPAELARGSYYTKSWCGRAARVRWNTSSGSHLLYLQNYVRFAPCGIGFHRIPTYSKGEDQIHPDWRLGTNDRTSGGCIRVSKAMSYEIWDYTAIHAAPVHVVGG